MNTTPPDPTAAELAGLVERLRDLLTKATPGDLATAQRHIDNETIECPVCNGEGEVEASDYCNIDGKALGVQFYGIGSEFGAHEALWAEAINALPTLLAALQQPPAAPIGERDQSESTTGPSGIGYERARASLNDATFWPLSSRHKGSARSDDDKVAVRVGDVRTVLTATAASPVPVDKGQSSTNEVSKRDNGHDLTQGPVPVDAGEVLRFALDHLNADTFTGDAIAEFHAMATAALHAAPAPVAGELHIGDKVEVIGQHEADFRGQDWWVAGIRVHDSGEGLDVTLAEQWPIPNRHWRNYRGQTDGFRPEELRVIAGAPDQQNAQGEVRNAD